MNKDEVKILQEVKELYCLPVTFKISEAIEKNIEVAIKHLYPKDSEKDQKKEKIKELVKSAEVEFKKNGIVLNLDQYESESDYYIHGDSKKFDKLLDKFVLIVNDSQKTLKMVKFDNKNVLNISLKPTVKGEQVNITFVVKKWNDVIKYKNFASTQDIWAQKHFKCSNNIYDKSNSNFDGILIKLEDEKDYTFLKSDYNFEKNKRKFYVGVADVLKDFKNKFEDGDIALFVENQSDDFKIIDYFVYKKGQWQIYKPLSDVLSSRLKGFPIIEYLDKDQELKKIKKKDKDKNDIENIKTCLKNGSYYKYPNGRNLYDLFSETRKRKVLDENEPSKDEKVEGANKPLSPKPVNTLLKSFSKFGNVIFYGVPGCGKSYFIKDLLNGVDLEYYSRVLFHPEYTYADFVGQLLPKRENKELAYPFVPGPFTEILNKALHDAEHDYFLIIEEINRGNAPQIFGDIFQLLDRDSEGNSEYAIYNADILKILNENGGNFKDVKIPKNLIIFATMNTCDQNVFVLDTAFKRRWRMHRIENTFDDIENSQHKEQIHHKIADLKIGEKDLEWRVFAKAINEAIVDINDGFEEDKQLGVWFVSEKELKDVDAFSEKVFMYLWNDVFKFERSRLFNTREYKTLDEIIKTFSKTTDEEITVGDVEKIKLNKRFNVFNENILIRMLELSKTQR